ncbi:MAG: helix-turn-helix transcriptional regulator [Bacteroides sp.]|nr:helix-turn-helix transcriptional regulator [Bacteroides sp.]
MKKRHFVQSHPLHDYLEESGKDYSGKDGYLIQSLQAMETVMDLDAYIIDYIGQRVLYATRNSIIRTQWERAGRSLSVDFFEGLILPEDLERISEVNPKVYEFLYNLPVKRRKEMYFTQDFRVWGKNRKPVLINHRGTILDLTESGSLRLTLYINSYPTHDQPGNSYIKLTGSHKVYEYIAASGRFVEVKTQKITSKALAVLELAGSGKSESGIAELLGISVHTVKYHKKKIFAQTGTKNTAEAIQWMNNQKKLSNR